MPLGSAVEAETLVSALLPSRLRDRLYGTTSPTEKAIEENEVRPLWSFGGSHGTWTAVAYDEGRGLVAFGDSQGNVDILRL